jgi:two-component system NtrC family sensor kinase
LGLSRPVYAQNDMFRPQMDSLAQVLSHEKTTKDSILILQKLVDQSPIPLNEAHYPDYMDKLLSLNKKENVINPVPYQLLAKSIDYWKARQYGKALSTIQASVTEFDKQHKSIMPLLFNMRFLYNFLNDQDDRLSYYRQKLEYYQVNGPVENTAPCYHGIAGYYLFKGAYNQAIGNYLKGADIFKRYIPVVYPSILSVVGSTYNAWGNNERATYYLERALKLQESKYTLYALQLIYLTLSDIAFEQHDYKKALEMINACISSIWEGPSQRLASGLVFKAAIYLEINKVDSAFILLNSVKAMSDTIPIKTVSANGFMEIDYNYYHYYLIKGNLSMAEKELLKAKADAFAENGIPLQLKYLRELGYFYKAHNNPALSGKYFDRYFQLNDSYQKSLNQFKVAQYEGEEKDRLQTEHINQLKQEKALQDYQLSQRNNLLWGALLVVLLISALSILIYKQLHANKKTLSSLRKTQRQLIQSEKMASLGELTAGIAHEIQNPLNFVNNFSEVNADKGDLEEIKAIATDIEENSRKINQHGKRADAIVKGMLQHSRTSSGQKALNDLNTLADEYLRLAYHGLRAKDKDFNADLITRFDEKLPKVNVSPQDIGRVMLNLFNNAFYAVNQKSKTAGADYKPTVEVKTSATDEQVQISVKDNGNGIPHAIKDKIMQPFFTTKPTGEGTGLGLSLSYDIVVKGYGGSIAVDSTQDEGSVFTVYLPII